MNTDNLLCIQNPTTNVDDTSVDQTIPPIGFATKVIARYYPQDFVNRVYQGYHRGDASAYGVINDFLRGNVPLFKQPKQFSSVYAAGLKLVHDLFKPPKLFRPVHFADLRFYPWELSTSAEEPLVSDPLLIEAVKAAHKQGDLPNTRMSKNALYNAAFGYNRTYVHNIKEADPKTDFSKTRTHFFDCTAHARSHLTPIEDPAKTRMVFGIPWLFLMVELMLLWPLMNWLRKGTTPIAWSYEIMTGGMRKLNQQTRDDDLYLCLDWSQFDKRTRYIFIDKIHAMWKSWMTKDSGYMPTVEYPSTTQPHGPRIFQQRINNLWNWMSAYLKGMDIKLPDDSKWRKLHSGVASGFMQTQILDSFINLLMLLTILIYLKVPLPEFQLVLGDDSVLIILILETLTARRCFKQSLMLEKSCLALS